MDQNKWDRGRVDDIVLRRVGVVTGHSLPPVERWVRVRNNRRT